MERILTLLRRYNIGYVLYTGGNDSADTSHRLAQAAKEQGHDLAIISLPKTIDNDLPATDHCPGYGSAGRFFAQATIDSTLNMRALRATAPIKVIEIPGRTAGWLVSTSALGKRDEADPPHLILVPEHPFREEQFLERVEAVYRRVGTVVIATSEAIHDEQGHFLGTAEPDQTDAFHHPQLTSSPWVNPGDAHPHEWAFLLLQFSQHDCQLIIVEAFAALKESIGTRSQCPVIDVATTAKGTSKDVNLLLSWVYSVLVCFLLFHALHDSRYIVNCQAPNPSPQQGRARISPVLKDGVLRSVR